MKKQPVHCAFLIKQIHDAIEKHANNELREKDLTLAQVRALIELDRMPSKTASLKELEKVLCIAQSTTAGIMARLEQKGFVESFGDPQDRRIKKIRLTAQGRACCADAQAHMDEEEQLLLSSLTEEEQLLLQQMLLQITNYIK